MTPNELEIAVAGLSSDELAEFRAWFEDYDADAWDDQIEADALAGRLDPLADAALKAHCEGLTHAIPSRS